MQQCWWLDEVVVTDAIDAVLRANEVRHAALVCVPTVANTVSHCLFDHDWRQGQGVRLSQEEIAFQLNYRGVMALDRLEEHPLANLFADGAVRVVREQVVKQKKKQKTDAAAGSSQKAGGFSFIELFAGIGGFRVAAEALGGLLLPLSFGFFLNPTKRAMRVCGRAESGSSPDVSGQLCRRHASAVGRAHG